MADFELVESFDIDHGELDAMSPQQCFVLGYELAIIDYLLQHEVNEISRPVHAGNRDRIVKRCQKAMRLYRLEYMQDDRSESWMTLTLMGPAH